MNFNINVTGLDINFTCPICESEVYAYIDDIPAPNYEAEHANGEYNISEETINCDNCDCEFTAEISVSISEGELKILDSEGNMIDDEDISITEYCADEDTAEDYD